jgi:ADP-ribose pyrophosphatase YjhB (NUDIX family)
MMRLQKTHFDFEVIRDKIIGAGIIPVAHDATGDPQLLLGKERYINHWRGSLKWSGFEGGRKNGEDVERTAAREFFEESLGVVRLHECDTDIDSVVDALCSDRYVARIVLCILHGEESERRYHVTYIVETAFGDACIQNFTDRRRQLAELEMKTQQLSRVAALSSKLELPREGEMHGATVVMAISEVERLDELRMRVCYLDNQDRTHEHEVLATKEACDAYVRWFSLRHECSVRIDEAYQHAVHVECDALGLVLHSHVVDDHIEKQSIRWWSASELDTVLQNGGLFCSEYFRAYFLPLLQQTLEELRGET